jgi:hypothetical protein
MTMNTVFKLSIAASLALTLSACGSTGTGAASQQQRQGHWIELGQADTGYQKTGAPVGLAYMRFSSLSANQELPVELVLTPRSDIASLRVRYKALDGARLVGVDEILAEQLQSGEALPLTVRVVSNSQAGGSLAIYVDTDSAGFKSSRAFEIRLNDQLQQKQSPNVEIGEDGGKYTTHNL